MTTAPNETGHSIPWFILFFDLIIVAGVSQVAHVYGENPSWEGYGYVATRVLVMFAIWGVTTLELLVRDSWPRRVLVMAQMLAFVVAILSVGEDQGLDAHWAFSALAIVMGTAAILVGMRVRRKEPHTSGELGVALALAASSLAFFPPALLPLGTMWGPLLASQWCFYGGTLIVVLASAVHAPRVILKSGLVKKYDVEERLGLILMIVLGESFLMLLGTVGKNVTIEQPWFLVATVLLVMSVWTLYFPSLAHAHFPRSVIGLRARLVVHLLLIFGVIDAIVALVALAKEGVDTDAISGARDTWAALAIELILVSILLLVIARDRRWTLTVTVLVVAIVSVAGLGLAGIWTSVGEADNLMFGAVVIVLFSGLLSVYLNWRAQRDVSSNVGISG